MYENNFNPMPYNMNYPQQPYYGSPQRQAYPVQTQPQQVGNTATNKLYANGIEDVKNRVLPANSDYIFLDNDKPLIYRKTVDGTGKMEVQTFKIVPYEEKQDPGIDVSNYVLKSDFDALKKEVESIKSNRKSGGAT